MHGSKPLSASSIPWILLVTVAFAPVFASAVLAQGTVSTYAGSSIVFLGAGQAATSAQIIGANCVLPDSQGNMYICAGGLAMVLKVAPSGTISIVAGNTLSGSGGDGGPATGASLGYPTGLALDSSGNLYISDGYTASVRMVNPSGIITTVAGGQGAGFSGDGGQATKAQLNGPSAVAVDKSGNLYIADTANSRIRMVTPNGRISTIAGTGAQTFGGDGGPATQASFSAPLVLFQAGRASATVTIPVQ